MKETADKSDDAIDEKVGVFRKEVNEKIVKYKEKKCPLKKLRRR